MTREEAIERLNIHKSTSVFVDSIAEAIDMAIEALQREEAEAKGYCHRIKPKEYFKNDAIKPSNDLINRADAIKRIANDNVVGGMEQINEYNNSTEYNGYLEGISDAITTIFDVPSAEQVISKLNNPCNSLVTDESNGSKEHKSKLDLISRQDVIEALCRSSVYAWSIEQDQTAHDWALNIIKALPSADAEQGVWEHVETTWADNIFKCSKCGNPLKIPTVDGEPIYDYCVCCGAKMGNVWGEKND